MSKSYKHTPYCGDNKGTKKKRFAWKRVRQWQKENPDFLLQGGDYKKLYCSYDICDYYWIETWAEYWKNYQEIYDNPNQEETYRKWYKYYKGK